MHDNELSDADGHVEGLDAEEEYENELPASLKLKSTINNNESLSDNISLFQAIHVLQSEDEDYNEAGQGTNSGMT